MELRVTGNDKLTCYSFYAICLGRLHATTRSLSFSWQHQVLEFIIILVWTAIPHHLKLGHTVGDLILIYLLFYMLATIFQLPNLPCHSFFWSCYRCMEATPSLACANKCVFCWRHHTNPVGKSWQWQMDDPIEIVNSAIDLHTNMIKQMKGVPGKFMFL